MASAVVFPRLPALLGAGAGAKTGIESEHLLRASVPASIPYA
jgi:hypothetical protein